MPTIPKILLVDDVYGVAEAQNARRVGILFGASRVVDARGGDELWSCEIEVSHNRGVKSLDALEVHVSTGQERIGNSTCNSLGLVRETLLKGWPRHAIQNGERWALVVLDLTFLSDPQKPADDPNFGFSILEMMSGEDLCPGLSVAILSDRDDEVAERAAIRAGGPRAVVVLSKREPKAVAAHLREILITHGLLPDFEMVGLSVPWLSALRTARARRRARFTLLRGSAGSGKEAISQYVHDWSERKGIFDRFALSSGATDPDIVALFGSERGVATNVDKNVGKFQRTSGGTLFLDELHNAAGAIQERLLDVTEHKADRSYYVTPLGSKAAIRVDPWVVAATNLPDSDLGARLETGDFRRDLFERLDGNHPIRIPSLRERLDDIPLLVRYFAESFNERHEVPPTARVARSVDSGFTDRLVTAVQEETGDTDNVRWLRNIVDNAIRSKPQLRILLPEHFQGSSQLSADRSIRRTLLPVASPLEVLDDTARALTPQSAVQFLEHADPKGVSLVDLDGILGRLEKASAAFSARVYIHALENQANPDLARKAIVRKLSGKPNLEGTQVSDQLLAWGVTWLANDVELPEWLKIEILDLAKTRKRNARRPKRKAGADGPQQG